MKRYAVGRCRPPIWLRCPLFDGLREFSRPSTVLSHAEDDEHPRYTLSVALADWLPTVTEGTYTDLLVRKQEDIVT